jgi:hypothetical protein
VAAPASERNEYPESSTGRPSSGVNGRASPAPSWSSSGGRWSTRQPRLANQAALIGVSGRRSGWRKWLGTNWPPLTTPALAVNTRSGTSASGSITTTSAPAASSVATSPSHWARACSGSTDTSRLIQGLIS